MHHLVPSTARRLLVVACTLLALAASPVLTGVVGRPPAAGATPHYELLQELVDEGRDVGCADVRWAARQGLLLPAEIATLADAGLACPDQQFLALRTLAARGELGCADVEWSASNGHLTPEQLAELAPSAPDCRPTGHLQLLTFLLDGRLTCADVEWWSDRGRVEGAGAADLRARLREGGADCPGPLGPGDGGEPVLALQQRLQALGYWVGPVDGRYGALTRQAVYAFEKAAGRLVDGRAGPSDLLALEQARRPGPAFPDEEDHLEIDKARQLLLVVRDGEVAWAFNTSTGTEERYLHPDSGWQLADTPPGRHRVTWQVDGTSEGELGPLYRPKFFHPDGIAVHGYGSVPPVPASHGCVRVTVPAMDFLWASGLVPVGMLVVVHGQAPG